jgi:hypothetical protein
MSFDNKNYLGLIGLVGQTGITGATGPTGDSGIQGEIWCSPMSTSIGYMNSVTIPVQHNFVGIINNQEFNNNHCEYCGSKTRRSSISCERCGAPIG